MDIPIVCIHGLNSHTLSFFPLKKYLEFNGYTNIICISYNSSNNILEKMLEEVDDNMKKIINIDKEIIVIGQSLGGLIANRLHQKNWKIKKSIYIGSPLNGSRLAKIVRNNINKNLISPALEIFEKKEKEIIPPHDYQTITMSWFGFSNFDGKVYKDEAIIEEKNNIHLNWQDHTLVFLNPRLWNLILNII